MLTPSSVIESAISAVYWVPFYFTFKFVFILWMALPQTACVESMNRSPSAEAYSAHTFTCSPAELRLSSARSCSPSSAATSRRRAPPPPIFVPRLTKSATRTKRGATTTTIKVARHSLSEQMYSRRTTQPPSEKEELIT